MRPMRVPMIRGERVANRRELNSIYMDSGSNSDVRADSTGSLDLSSNQVTSSKASSSQSGLSQFNLSRFSMVKAFIALIFTLLVGVSSGLSTIGAQTPNAQALDYTKFVACGIYGKDSMAGKIYQLTQSTDMQFSLRSKNTINYGYDKVQGGLNNALELSGMDFKKTNEEVLGRTINGTSSENIDENAGSGDTKSKFNGGKAVNPYQRFGVAGLKFTSYIGEWRHVVIDACGDDSNVMDPKAGDYYEGRLAPMSTWDDKDRSKDIRTRQFDFGFGIQYLLSITNEFSNIIFFFTKLIVVGVLALINFSFTDIGTTLGITKLIYGDENGSTGLIKTLHEGFFLPLFAIMAAITALYVFFSVARRRRSGSGGVTILGRSVLMFILAVVIAANPLKILTIPNDAAVTIQGIFANAMDKPMQGGKSGLCSGETDKNTKLITRTGDEDEQLASIGKNVQQTIGCTIWEQFLFKPWAQAQFGDDWNNLWAEGKVPSWAKDGKTIGNKNGSWVGSPTVPMGGGTKIDNWALFQVSTQTNVHSPIGHDGKTSKITDGIANDWWRIVDAMSNYQELGTRSESQSSTSDTSVINHNSGKWVWPTKQKGKISSGYGNRGLVDAGGSNFHKGVDFAGACGDPIYAAADGTVKYTGKELFGANTILIQHKGGIDTFYVHMDDGGTLVKEGDKVTAGQKIGKIGQSGNAYGCHLHFEVRKGGNGKWAAFDNTVDPDTFMKGAVNGEVVNDNSSTDDNEASSGSDNTKFTTDFARPVADAKPTYQWYDWNGDSLWNRLGTSATSVLVAIVGLFAPLYFSLFTAVYALGISLLMVVAPIMFLLAAGPDSTFRIFTAWGRALWMLFIKRVVMGLMLVFSLVLTAIALNKFSTVGWWTGILMMVAMSIALWKLKGKIIEMLTRLSGGSGSMGSVMNSVTRSVSKTAVNSSKIAGATVAGGVAAKKNGGSLLKGANTSFKNQTRNALYTTPMGRAVITQMDTAHYNDGVDETKPEDMEEIYCARCGRKIGGSGIAFHVARDGSGNYYCMDCYNDGQATSGARVIELDDTKKLENFSEDKKHHTTSHTNSSFKQKYQEEVETELRTGRDKSGQALDKDQMEERFKQSLKNVALDIGRVKYDRKNGPATVDVEIPDGFGKYLDKGLVAEAWQTGNYDYIANAYTVAYALWYKNTTGQSLDEGIDHYVDLVQEWSDGLEKGDNIMPRSYDYTKARSTTPGDKVEQMDIRDRLGGHRKDSPLRDRVPGEHKG